MKNIYVSNQYAANSLLEKAAITDSDVPVVETALQHVNMNALSARAPSGRGQGVVLMEMPVTGLLVLRTRTEQAALAAALKSTLGLDVPDVLSANVTNNAIGNIYDQACVRWMAPDEWLLSCPLKDAFAVENGLREALENCSIAIVNVSGGFTSLMLHGVNAIDVLKKSTGYDVHASNFMSGKVVNTVFAKAQVTLRCIDTNQYELIIRRSFADYVWHWIQVASAEYGLSIETYG